MAALLSAALLLTGCGGQRAPQPKRSVSIGAVGYSEDDTYIGELLACLRQDVKDLSEKDRPVTGRRRRRRSIWRSAMTFR